MLVIARAHDRKNVGAAIADENEWSLSQIVQATALLEVSIAGIPAEAWSGDLEGRIKLARETKPLCLIEPHCDNLPENPAARGAYVLSSGDNPAAYDLARDIVAELTPIVPALNHGGLWMYRDGTRWAARGDDPASYQGKRLALLELASTAGIIVECGYLSNIDDRTWLLDKANRARIGRAIGRACVGWYLRQTRR